MEKHDRIGFYICDRIGFYGPVILLVVIVLLLVFQRQWLLLVVVILWQFFSYGLNVVLKNTLAKPRPFPNDVVVPSSATYWTKHNYYGMPSGHAQAVFGQLTFIWLYFSTTWLKLGSLLVAMITVWQRFHTHMHSVAQLLAGALVGGLLAKLFYFLLSISRTIQS
jgi:membrane-associated phospholipid phosphatase